LGLVDIEEIEEDTIWNRREERKRRVEGARRESDEWKVISM